MEGSMPRVNVDGNVTPGCQQQENLPSSVKEPEASTVSNKDPSMKNSLTDHIQQQQSKGNTTENGYTIYRNVNTHEENINAVPSNSGSRKDSNVNCIDKPGDAKYLGIKHNISSDDTTGISLKTINPSGNVRENTSERTADITSALVDGTQCVEDTDIPHQEMSKDISNVCLDNSQTMAASSNTHTKMSENTAVSSNTHTEMSENTAVISNIHTEISENTAVSSNTHTEMSENTAVSSNTHTEMSESAPDKSIIYTLKSENMKDRRLSISEELNNEEHSTDSQNQPGSLTGQSIDNLAENVFDDDESDEPSEDLHTTKLGKICRICGEMTVKYDGPKKGVPKHEVVKHVKKVWNVDISDENSDIYPVNVCLSCERKIKRLYSKISKRKKCEIFRQKPAEFVEHSKVNCSVCLLKERTPSPPRLPSCELSKQEINAITEVGKNQNNDTDTRVNSRPQTLLESRRNSARKRNWEDQGIFLRTVGCQTELDSGLENMTGLEEHDYTQDETLSQFLVLPKKLGGRTPYQKQSLSSVNAKYIRQDRLKPLIAHIDKFCQVHKEDKIDAMFFLLMQTLRDAGDRARENLVLDIWCKKNNVGMSLTEEECLAKRILLKQTKDQYRKEYSYYKEKLEKSVLKPPFIIDKLEKTYFPEYLEYFVTDGDSGPVIYQHEKSTHPSYFTITDSPEGTSKGDNTRTGVMGARWRYFDAVAKTLEELSHSIENEIQEIDEDFCIRVDMFDYCEEKRDLTNFSDKNDSSGSGRGVQSKMITYFFGVQSLHALVENKITSIYKSSSNTIQFRPLMKALVAEGTALHPAIMTIDEERAAITDKIFHITLPSGTPLRFKVFFANSSLEIRKDYRNISGLTLSSFKKVPVVINRYGTICLELKRSWLATSPRLVHVSRVTNSRTKCSRCGEQGHNVRKCSVSSEVAGDIIVHHKKRKKQRTVPSPSYSTTIGQTTQVFAKDSKMLDLVPQQQQPQQPQHHHPHQESQNPLSHLATGATAIDQNSGIIRSDEQILWTCPGLGSTPAQIGTHAPQGTQVLIPTHVPSSSAEYQSVPQRSHTQISQGTSAPVYVWTYTVVQPQQGSSQQHPQQLSLVHHQPAQQAVSQHSQQLSVVHQQTAQQDTSQQHQQISVVHQQPTQPGTPQQHQQLSVVHQQSGQQSAAQQSQQLSVIHQQTSQQPPPQQTQMSVIHQQQIQRPSQQQAATPQINLIAQQSNHPQTVQQSQQQLSVVHQQPTTQPQTPQQLSVVHQQQTSQSVNIVHQQGPQSQTTQPEASSPQQQLIHPQSSELQPIIGQW